ncbi:serine/threonine-protein kinase [Dactylosporangium sp. CA-052675]|uniref:serine/threonine-protein kinase n=1 Tax=Dactylosporangium sp. CA-052675 TaxID=3239927 RepID=UPI003D8D3A66
MTEAPMSGRTVTIAGKRWHLGAKLGQGGGGSVFAASSDAGEDAAVKFVLKAGNAPRDNLIQRPDSELRNILPIWASGEDGDWWTFVMPRGEMSLEAYLLSRATPLREREALEILRDVVTALCELEHHGVVHRDIKPGNVVRCDGRWQVVDFGIARLVEAATATFTKRDARSAPYAAVERWRDERAGCPSDVYSWGVMAFELLSGQLPFPGPREPDYRRQHLQESPPTLVGPSPSLAGLVAECLSKAPGSRPSATEISRRLERLDEALPPGLEAVRDANYRIVLARGEAQAGAQRWRSAREDLEYLWLDALASFRRLSQRVRFELRGVASAAEDRSYGDGWRMRLGTASLSLGLPSRIPDSARQAASLPFTVVAHARMALEWRSDTPHTGRSHALWYCDANSDDRFHWYHSAYRWRGGRTSPEMPFALAVDDAADALKGEPGDFAVALPLTRLDHDAVDEFIDQWAGRLAKAALGGGGND